jgi:hypothetical protein
VIRVYDAAGNMIETLEHKVDGIGFYDSQTAKVTVQHSLQSDHFVTKSPTQLGAAIANLGAVLINLVAATLNCAHFNCVGAPAKLR